MKNIDARSKLIGDFFDRDITQLKEDYPSIVETNTRKKTFLYRQGDCCSNLFWIKNGIVKLSHLTERGNEITIGLLRKGDVIGRLQDNSVDQDIDETAEALNEVNCYRISHSDFKTMMSRQTELAWLIIEDMYARKQRIESRLRAILTQPIEVRVVSALLELAEMFGIKCTQGIPWKSI
ncbi:hypothetical protein W03_19210 [Nitrosomonas sp. PY1]|uniref:Crp/Fnr family transcriptional regulator n=1 Tax=Nitrosomonas sp. PY1 TaxID=1803906 RepID=UPI001FC7EAA9|nr:Crp/Fnr family transcriptional regulator [Nitrosomonas sp. PY1]GKS69917.1 hypothetical protein W03_19210 [Nitrosomonas sp. PY1]